MNNNWFDSNLDAASLLCDLEYYLRTQMSILLPLIGTITDCVSQSHDCKAQNALAATTQTLYRVMRETNNIRELLRFLRNEEVINTCDINYSALCRDVISKINEVSGHLKTSVRFNSNDNDIHICGDSVFLERMLYNLITAAVVSSNGDKDVDISLTREAEKTVLLVNSSGNFGENNADSGNALLMFALCEYIAKAHNGILFKEYSQNGTVISVSLPIILSGNVTFSEHTVDYAGEIDHSLIEVSCLPLVSPVYLEKCGKKK